MRLILYSKPGCHLCEGLQEKLEQIHTIPFDLEIRDITTNDQWFEKYQYEIPVLYLEDRMLPRPSPRSTVQQLESMLQKYMSSNA
ncbi:glutaredoxin family protein [Leptolyngbya sp. AN03gr2]|uniref:glutaredoxin family protein n=1 Tax=unclassified Leptolyngbya TaxID=2650499 RepID=UPI003D320F8F